MSKRAMLTFTGSLTDGFQVMLEISEGNTAVFTEARGALPPAIELLQLLTQWQRDYYQSLRLARIVLESISVTTGTLVQVENCKKVEAKLKLALQNWLGAREFQPIDKKLRETIRPQEPVEILLRTTSESHLYDLPWHCWDFIECYPQAELVASSPSAPIVLPPRTTDRVRILAILGSQQGIDTATDRLAISTLPNVDVVLLDEPTREQLNSHLREQVWEILFFAGHSKTEGEKGRIYLNANESLTLQELCHGFKAAIAKGLQLAIFNSCDGLGLAEELGHLHLPQAIVLRLPVPDRVAQEFLKQFLNAFVTGESLHIAVRQARECLQGLEGEFTAASWLPIVFQNPAVPALIWQSLQGHPAIVPQPQSIPTRPPKIWERVRLVTVVSLVVTGCVMGVRYLGMLQAWELSAFDLLMRSRPPEKPDPRIAIITVTEADLQIQTYEREPRRGSLSDRSLAKLLTKLAPARPNGLPSATAIAIGLDIYRDYPASKSEPDLIEQLRTSDRLVGICQVSAAETGEPGVAPPPELATDNVGFSDVLLDPDRVLRRHYLALDPPPASLCKTHYALSVQLALRYLASKGIELEYLPNDTWQLGKLTFAPLEAHNGGYQQIDLSGHQILLNYQATPNPIDIAPRVTLQQVLSGQIGADTFKDRIVLIGTTAPSFHDALSVPYTTDRGEIQSIPGVVIQAQMVSQLLAAAIDGRPLIRSLPFWADLLAIWGIAVAAGLLAIVVRRPLYLVVAGAGAIAIWSGTCLFLLQSGFWAPFVPVTIALVGSSMTKLIDRSMANEI
jgi:CHASE2 domain-containing sensor protein